MASGNITGEFDDRLGGSNGLKPICGLTLEIVVASGTSEKEEELDEVDHTCMNCLLTDLYIEAPPIVTGVANEFKLELLTERNNVIYSTGDLAATNATNHPIHLQRGLRGTIKFVITADGNVNENETFMIEVVGM